MTFLWNLIGLSPIYEIICGSCEVLGGILLLYRPDLYVASSGRAYTRSTDGELWLSGINLDPKKHTVLINCYFIGDPTNYAWQLSDPNHLVLTSLPPDPPKPDPKHKPARPSAPFTPAVLTLPRTPTPAHYPLLERGFHLISEWRYER